MRFPRLLALVCGLFALLLASGPVLAQCANGRCYTQPVYRVMVPAQTAPVIQGVSYAPTYAAPTADSPATFLALLNAARAQAGRPPLAWDQNAANLAATNAGIHTRSSMLPYGGQCWYGGSGYTAAFYAWMASPAHRAILMNATRAVGVARCPTGITADAY